MINKRILDRLEAFLKNTKNNRLSITSNNILGLKGIIAIGICSEYYDDSLKKYLEKQRSVPHKSIADFIIEEMNKKGLDRREVCERASIAPAFLSKILCNNKAPKRETMMALALALDLKEYEYSLFLNTASMKIDTTNQKENIVRFCLIEGANNPDLLNLSTVNELLSRYGEEPFECKHRKTPDIDISKCDGCGLCAKDFPEIFEIRDGKARITYTFSGNIKAISKAEEQCPAQAISIKSK